MQRRSVVLLLALVFSLALGGVARAQTLGWERPTTLSGLLGSYVRAPGSTAPLVYVTFAGSDGDRASGPFSRFFQANGALVLQRGSYQAIGDNPAIGAIVSFFDENGDVLDNWAILGIERDPLGHKIIAVELQPMDGSAGPVVLQRVGL